MIDAQKIDDANELARLLSRKTVLLLDFDGPICSVFAGFPAHVFADQLREIMIEGGKVALPLATEITADPFEVLAYASTLNPTEGKRIQAALSAHELEAISTATPTPYAHDLIRKWSKGHKIAVVSNNSKLAVESYLNLHDLTDQVDFVSARESSNPQELKPDPHLVKKAFTALRVSPQDCVLLGDSVSDIHAARSAGVDAIGYANRAGKLATLEAAGANLIITSVRLIYESS